MQQQQQHKHKSTEENNKNLDDGCPQEKEKMRKIHSANPQNMSLLVAMAVLTALLATVDSACVSHNDCLSCLQEKPDLILEGLFCVMCLNTRTNNTICMGNFGETLKIATCATKADTVEECNSRFATTTTTRPTTTVTPSPTPFATLSPTPLPTTVFFAPSTDDNDADGSGGGGGVAIAIGVVVALVVLAAFVLAGIYIVLKYRKNALQQNYPTYESSQGQPSFAVGSGRVMDNLSPASGYSGRETYVAPGSNSLDASSDSRPYSAMPYSPSERSNTNTVDMMRSSNSKPIREQYYDLDVIRPPPKTIDLHGNARESGANRSGTIADNLPDIPGAPSGYSGKSKMASEFDNSMAIRQSGVDGDGSAPASLRALDDAAAAAIDDADAPDAVGNVAPESESTRMANEFDAMQAMLEDV
jgi:hypothetical protein